jgi:carboxymethylenebutenolidase
MIEFTRPDGARAPGYLASPANPAGAPGIVMFEEWWGLNDEIIAAADRLAAAGFRVLVPDLFRGRTAASGDEANHMMEGLDFVDAANQDGRGGALYLKKDGGKVGVTGFCMGGALTLLCALHVPEFSAAVVFYGFPPEAAGDPATIKIPFMGHFAERDEYFPIARVAEIEQRLAAGGVSHEIHRYDAKHAFANPVGLGNYHEEHAENAWKRTIDFFNRTLR